MQLHCINKHKNLGENPPANIEKQQIISPG